MNHPHPYPYKHEIPSIAVTSDPSSLDDNVLLRETTIRTPKAEEATVTMVKALEYRGLMSGSAQDKLGST